MRKLALLGIVIAAALLSGCSTYKPARGSGPGYSEMQIDTNVYRVSFRGDGATKPDQADEMSLLRCAELMAEKGFPFFVIQSGQAFASTHNYTTPLQVKAKDSKATVTGGQSYTINTPSVIKTVIGLIERPASGIVYDTQQIVSSLSPKYRK